MNNRKLRKAVAFILTFALLAVSLPFGLAEEAGGEGTVIILDVPTGEPAAEPAEPDTLPFIPDNVKETVFSYDEPDDSGINGTVFNRGAARVTVKDTNEYPYSAIANMVVHSKCGCNWSATGFMVGRDRMLTAAHCLVCDEHGEWADRITFYFGYKDDSHYLYKYDGAWTAYAGNLFSGLEYTLDWDYGCVKLEEPVGDCVGWFGYRYGEPDSTFYTEYLYVAGYRHGVLKYDSGYATPDGRQHIMYTMDTEPGTSGGPVFTEDYHALAINIAENDETNYGYRLVDYVIDELNKLK